MALTNWNDILNKPKGIDEVPEIALTVEQLSASVLSLGEDVGEVAEDVQEIVLEISQLSASTLPYSPTKSIKQKVDEINSKGLVYRSLLTATAISTTENTYNTYDSRKFSDYDIIVFILTSDIYGNDYRDTQVLPAGMFAQTGKKFTMQVLHGAVSESAADYSVSNVSVEYNSDTSVKAIAGGKGIINILQIIGIKFE